jgi:hypothetical protein
MADVGHTSLYLKNVTSTDDGLGTRYGVAWIGVKPPKNENKWLYLNENDIVSIGLAEDGSASLASHEVLPKCKL